MNHTTAPRLRGDIDQHIGRRLRQRRRLLEMRQIDLAAALQVRFQQIQKYECGANRISAANLWSLAQALNVPVSYFFEGLQAAAPGPASRDAAEPQRAAA